MQMIIEKDNGLDGNNNDCATNMINEQLDLYSELQNLKSKIETKIEEKKKNVNQTELPDNRMNFLKRWVASWLD